MLFYKLKINLCHATCYLRSQSLKALCIMSYYNEIIIKERLCFDFARHCINSYFEQTQWQQPADAKRYLSSIIYVFSLSLPLVHPTHTLNTSHMVVHKHKHCQGCAWLPRRSSTNAHTIAFPVRQKLAPENGSFPHFESVFWFRVCTGTGDLTSSLRSFISRFIPKI